MKNKFYYIFKSLTIVSMYVSSLAIAQVQTLPYYHNFGVTSFTTLPPSFSSGVVSGAPISSQTAAQTASVTGVASIVSSTSTQTVGGSYGYASSNNGRFYIQNSSSSSVGTNQLNLNINTLGWHGVQVNYDIEMMNANPRTAGVVLQYRVGTSGAWSNVSGGVYAHNSTDRVNGQIDNFTNLVLPTAADNKPIVQLRWSTWRGTQTGAHSGTAIDNVSIAAKYAGTNTLFSVSTASGCNELFISEYVHDNTVNRAIEIYNPTALKVDLSNYYLTITSGTNAATYIPLSGVVAPHKTWVVANKEASAPILAVANQLTSLSYSGNDIIGLVYSTNPLSAITIIDKIGDVFTPVSSGWPVSVVSVGTNTGTTQNQTLTRLMNRTVGNVEWSTAQHEWFSHPVNTYSFLGWHNSACSPADMPTAAVTNGSEVVDISGSSSTAYSFPIGVALFGTWSNDIYVLFDDSYNYNSGGGFSCQSPVTPQGYYTYYNSGIGTNAKYIKFDASLGSAGSSYATFSFDINALNLNSYMTSSSYPQTFTCFRLEDNPGDPGMFYFGSVITDEVQIKGGSVGIEEFFNNKQIQIYPNPATNNLTITNKSKSSITHISITDVVGQEVYNTKPNDSQIINVNISNFANGVYFVKLNNNNDSFTLKIIKQ